MFKPRRCVRVRARTRVCECVNVYTIYIYIVYPSLLLRTCVPATIITSIYNAPPAHIDTGYPQARPYTYNLYTYYIHVSVCVCVCKRRRIFGFQNPSNQNVTYIHHTHGVVLPAVRDLDFGRKKIIKFTRHFTRTASA